MLKLPYDITNSTFKYVESLWLNYREMIKKMNDIEKDVINIQDENQDIKGQGKTSDPTAQEVLRKEKLKRNKQYATLQANVQAIEYVLNILPNDYARVAKLAYMTKPRKNWNQIADAVGYSNRHTGRIRRTIVTATAEKLGLW